MESWNVGSLGVQYDGDGISLSLLFMSASELAKSDARERYQQLAHLANNAAIKRDKLPSIAA
jgi:hypothetical protein